MLISVVCPVFNEAKNIQGLIDFFIQAEPADKELILIDGGSQDDTAKIIQQNCTRYPNIKLLHNPHKIVPYALNLAIPICQGSYIVRLDGHSQYADDYFLKILEAFSKTDAGIVGGPTRTHYASPTQEAIAFAVSHPMGIGDSKVHNELYEGYTDSVTFGSWKKEIFEITGLFDVRLVRNQDDEFHYRAKSKGIKIYQYPDIKLYYSPRSSFISLFKQYFQYGLYKPLVLKKVRSEIKLRHLIPSLFVGYLLLGMLLMHFPVYFLPLALYILLAVYVSFFNSKSIGVKLRILIALPCIHIAYGSGFLIGILKTFQKVNYEIVKATKDDLLKIAACHRKAFPAALASQMGDAFLVKMFDWYLSTNHTFLFFIESSNRVVGYCGGMIVDGTLAHGSSSSMTQYTFNEAIKALLLRPWLFLHPDFLSRYAFFGQNILTRFRNKFRKKEIRSVGKPREPHTGLVVIGVDPAFQGKGFGSSLLTEFERLSVQKGFKKMMLSVKSDNNQAIKSYTRNGWIIANRGEKSTSMEKRVE